MTTTEFDVFAPVTAAKLAKALDVTPARVRQLVAEGWIKRSGRDSYPLQAAVHGYLRSLEAARERRAAKAPMQDRLRTARAREIETRIEQRLEKLVDVREYSEIIDEFIAICRQEFRSFPAQLARLGIDRDKVAAELTGIFNRIEAHRAKHDAKLGIARPDRRHG